MPKVYEQKVCLQKCTYRQLFVKDLARDLPTILLTNDPKIHVASIDSALCKAHAHRQRPH